MCEKRNSLTDYKNNVNKYKEMLIKWNVLIFIIT